MRIAVISDIHGNKVALDAVLADIRNRSVEKVICLGDLVGYMPYVNEVIETIKSEQIICVKGNHDKKIAEMPKLSDDSFRVLSDTEKLKSASAAYMNWVLSEENHTFINSLPEALVLTIENKSIRLLHGSPLGIDDYLFQDLEKMAALVPDLAEDMMMCGHTHIAYHVELNEKQFLNPGSVGKPKAGDSRAMYMVVEIKESMVTSEVIQVPYDIQEIEKAIRENPYIADSLVDSINGEESKQQLITCAMTLIANEGMGGLTFENLAVQSGMRKESISRHFETIEQLTKVLIDRLMSIVRTPIEDQLPDTLAYYFNMLGGQSYFSAPTELITYRVLIAFYSDAIFKGRYIDEIKELKQAFIEFVTDGIDKIEGVRIPASLAELILIDLDGLGFHYLIEEDVEKYSELWRLRSQVYIQHIRMMAR